MAAFSGVEMHANFNELLLPTTYILNGGGKEWVAKEREGEREKREREREEERLLQLPCLFCLRDFLGQIEAVTIKPKRKKQLFILKQL